jgi:hypothetical protein
MLRRHLLLLASLAVVSSPAVALDWPEVRRETKPWSRWWWFGNVADKPSLTAALESAAAAGLGGLEVTPIYGARGYEDRFVDFLSPEWVALLEHTLVEARRLDLGIDLATGTGWPFGGPWLSPEHAAHYVAHRSYTVAPGARLAEPVAFTQPPVVRFAGPRRIPLSDLPQPVTAYPNLQDIALDQVRFEQPLPLVTLMAFPASPDAAPLDLTARVDSAGQLDWTAPADHGPWTLHALFSGPHGKMVERAAPGGEGFALDHFSSTALQAYLARFDAAFEKCHIMYDTSSPLRAFFNDSYEVDDSAGEANWTPRFLAEFQKRRGYDLRQHLPALFSGPDTRVLSDYRETISDLLLEEFTIPWRNWANARGALIRNQAHNAPASLLDLYAASDIPEQEGNGLLAMKLASSAAHLTGKRLASAETATWLNEHWVTTLAELKHDADTFLLSGINHLCYHGTAFSPLDAPWPGFNFYASVELNPHNPLWSDFPALNTYITRAQSFLQHGRPDEDVLLYHNIHDTWAERRDNTLPHFGHGSDQPVGVTAATLAAELHARGIGFDYVSDRLLSSFRVENGRLTNGTTRHRALVLPAIQNLPAATLTQLAAFADAGATLLFHRHLPENPAGLLASREDFNRTLAQLRRHLDRRVHIADDLASLLSSLPREPLVDLGLAFVRRTSDAGPFYFLVNRSDRPIDTWIPFTHARAHAALFDPVTGAIARAAVRDQRVYLQLAPGASTLIQFLDTPADVPPAHYVRPSGPPLPLTGEWSLAFEKGGPTLPPPARLDSLASWTDSLNEETKSFAGTARYTLAFAAPTHQSETWQLDLGEVRESARVLLNGRPLATLIQSPFRVVIPSDLLRPHNTLEIVVTNLAANRIADLDRRRVPWKIFYNANMPARLPANRGPDGLFTAAHWSPRPSGLLGPVTLTPLESFTP